MYLVSDEYRALMFDPLVRQTKNHCRVFVGVFDETADDDKTVTVPIGTYYSNIKNVGSHTKKYDTYATFEPKFFRVDGSLRLAPNNTFSSVPQAWIGNVQSDSEGNFAEENVIRFDFEDVHSFVGVTLIFGNRLEESPKEFTLTAYSNGTLVRSLTQQNTDYESKVEFPVADIDALELRFDSSQSPYGRPRLCDISFGIGYIWEDSDLISTSEKHEDSPLSTELNRSSFSFTLNNYAGDFDVDKDTSLARFLREGQKVTVSYGVELSNGSTEWIPGGVWFLSTWSTTDTKATFNAEDVLTRLSQTTYDKGVFDFGLHSVAELVKSVLHDAGFADAEIYVGNGLDSVSTVSPIPIVSHAEALQLLANLGMARLFIDRKGRVCVKQCSYLGSTSSSTLNATEYSDVSSVDAQSENYATFEPQFFRVDGSLRLLPDSAASSIVSGSGLTGSYQSGDLSTFTNPLTWIGKNGYDAFDANTVDLDFGGQIPSEIKIYGFKTEWSDAIRFNPTENAQTFSPRLEDVYRVKVEISGSKLPKQRGHIAHVHASGAYDFNITQRQIFSGGKGQITPRLRSVYTDVVDRTVAQSSETVESDTVTLFTNGTQVRVEHGLMSRPQVVYAGDSGVGLDGVTIEATHYAYVSYVSITAKEYRSVDVKVVGSGVTETPMTTAVQVYQDGDSLQITNPVLDPSNSGAVLNWITSYYKRRTIQNFKIRGFPELDSGDIIRVNGKLAQVISTNLTYNGAFTETIEVREE